MAQSASSIEPRVRDLRDRPVPDLVTAIPGPKARAHVAFDQTWTSPSLPRAYPFAPVRGYGMAVEDIDGNVFLDFAAGIAVNSTGHGHPRVLAAIREQAAELIHYSASDFYLPIYAETAREVGMHARPVVGGVFVKMLTVPAVWHKEILWAMSCGVHVYGAASMGAL